MAFENDSEDDDFEDHEEAELPTIKEKHIFLRKMSQQLVQEKIKKINCFVDIYQYV